MLRLSIRLMLIVSCWAIMFGCAPARVRVVAPVPFSQYRAPFFDWIQVRRVLILPLFNESPEPHASQEIRQVLAAELQSFGQFEVLVAPFDEPPEWSRRVRINGTFDEIELVELAQNFHADTVLCGSVTQYHSYTPPRIGLSLRLISTAESVVIASIDGFWDSSDHTVAEHARWYHDSAVNKSQANSSPDAIFASPRLFQKYVCHQAALVLNGPGRVVNSPATIPTTTPMPAGTMIPPDTAMPPGTVISPAADPAPSD